MITLNRPKHLNALSDGLVRDLTNALGLLQDDKEVGAIILTGSDKAFAAGADIREMKDKTYMECYRTNMLAQWQDITKYDISFLPLVVMVVYALGLGSLSLQL